MRTSATITGLLAVPLFAGCGEARAPGPSVELRSVVLHDVQGLFGGHALWVAEDRAAVVQVVGAPPAGKSGLWEKRHKFKLTAEQLAEMERLVGAHHFLTLKVAERPGVPDEAHAIIVVVTKTGTTATARKWANDKNQDFDPHYEYLLGICQSVDGEQPIYEGAFDWEWSPAGFERPW
jgi:hypothetical protein